jgi:hypothetical protein
MARYYFHLQASDGLFHDEEGQDLPTPEKARALAIEAARELVASAIKTGRDLEVDAIVMEDDSGQTKMLVPLADVIPPRFRG